MCISTLDMRKQKSLEVNSNANDIIDMVLDIKFNGLITIALVVDYPNNI